VISAPAAAPIPALALCRNTTCISAAYRQMNRAHFLPIEGNSDHGDASGGTQHHELGTLGPSREAPSPIDEAHCRGGLLDVEAEVVSRVSSAIEWSQPLVLRGCAANMPAVSRWSNDTYLRAHSPAAFAPILSTDGQGFTSVNTLDQLHPGLITDVWWPSPVDYDTFDNLHVVVSGTKTFRLVSPGDAALLYADFVLSECPGPGRYGCDDLGCFSYVPFNAAAIDTAMYPRVAEAKVFEASLTAGDILLIPSFWFHYILHHPLTGNQRGRCVALTFAWQREAMKMVRPFAEDLRRYWDDRSIWRRSGKSETLRNQNSAA